MHVFKLRIQQLSATRQFILALVITVVKPTIAAIDKCEVITFKLVQSNYGIEPIGTPETVTSLDQCMDVCTSKYRSCYGIIFNSVTRLCTPGSFLTTSGRKPKHPEERLLSMGHDCDESRGFSVGTLGDVASCFYISNEIRTYSKARNICQGSGGQLYTMKIEEKWEILGQRMTKDIYIGMNDLEREGVFKWSDGTPVEPWQYQYFYPSEPNDLHGNEDCVHTWIARPAGPNRYLLNDRQCEVGFGFACEQPDP